MRYSKIRDRELTETTAELEHLQAEASVIQERLAALAAAVARARKDGKLYNSAATGGTRCGTLRRRRDPANMPSVWQMVTRSTPTGGGLASQATRRGALAPGWG